MITITKLKYNITIGGETITNDTNSIAALMGMNADLISLRYRKSDSSTENDLTMVFSNKHYKYNGKFKFQDAIDVQLIAEEWTANSLNPLGTIKERRTYHICSGQVTDINLNYQTCEIMASGSEVDFSADANVVDYTYPTRESWGSWKEIIDEVVNRQGEGHNVTTFPGGIIALGMDDIKAPAREWTVSSYDSCQTTLDKICAKIGAHWYSEPNIVGLATLYIIHDGETGTGDVENIDGHIILDSYAQNGLDFLNRIVVIAGNSIPLGQPDDYLPTCTTIKAVYNPSNDADQRSNRSTTVIDKTLTTQEDAQKRAEEIYNYGRTKYSVLKITLANHAPHIGQNVSWTVGSDSPMILQGTVQAAEIIFDPSSGFLTTLDVKSNGVGSESVATGTAANEGS